MMNVYNVSVGPKPASGSGIGAMATGRTIYIVTDTIQNAMSIARVKLKANEEITGIYISGEDAIVDYSQVIATGGN